MDKLLIDKVKQNLRTLLLNDMAESLESELQKALEQKQGHLQLLNDLLDIQLVKRRERSLQRKIKKAMFPRRMSFENFDWGFQSGLNVEYLKNLKELGFVRNKNPLMILGISGCGKTHIATSLGINACKAGFKVRFYKLQEILNLLYASLADDSTDELLNKLSKMDLMILDGVNYIRTKPEFPSLFLDLVSACQDKVSLITTTNISIEEWGPALGNPSVINAAADRLFHRAEILNIHPALSYRTHGPHAPKIPSKAE